MALGGWVTDAMTAMKEDNRKYKILGGHTFCKSCKITIKPGRYRKHYIKPIGILCDFCVHEDIKGIIRKKLLDNFTKQEREMIRKLALIEYSLFE